MLTVYETFDFDEIPSNVSEDIKKTYVSSMIDLAKEDKNSVNVYLIVVLGFLGFIFTQDGFAVFKDSLFLKMVLFTGCICLIVSAICFFWYWRKIHKCQIDLTGCILSLNVEKAQRLWIELWMNNKSLFKAGLVLIFLGTGIISVTFLIKVILT